MTTGRYEHAIGASLATMQYLFQLGIKAPRDEFKPYSVVKETGAGDTVGQGWAVVLWDWGFISDTNRAKLKILCANLSASVYVRVYNDSLSTPAWETYRSKMMWPPTSEDRQNDHRIKFALSFKLLEKITI